MQFGDAMMIVALFVTVAAVTAYMFAAFGRREFVSLGRAAYLASAAALTLISAYCLWLILGNHFEVEYIFSNSSKDLPLLYKISAFWAGQQGSFLVWAFFGAVLGVFIMLRGREFEPWLMAVWAAIQALFMVLLLADSPFKLLPAPPDMLAQVTDGQGLRELLQNPWMAIHPPATFIGYAAMCVPAAFAVAALAKGDLNSWCRTTLPWAVFGWLTLGLGIILGAYWSYGVLGWGGYWAWDPVENASLVPWLTGTALLHGMLAERYRGSFRRTNIALALVTFLLVFYATFLTRSNALKDFSVHTFGGTSVGFPLLCFMGAFLLLSVGLAVWRWRRIESQPSYTTFLSKDFLFFLGIILFLASAALLAIGTSAPIIRNLVAEVASHLAKHIPIFGKLVPGKIAPLDRVFYNRTHAPIALIVLALMSLAPVLAWRRGAAAQEGRQPGSLLATLAVLVVALTVFAAFLVPRFLGRTSADRQSLYLWVFGIAIALVAVMGLVTNGVTLWRTRKSGLRLLGGLSAHVGMAVLFLGMILSANGQESNGVLLKANGKPSDALGYRLAYAGKEEMGERKSALKIRIEHGRTSIDADVITEITRQNEFYPHPYIVKSFARDLYIAPQAVSGAEQKVLARGGKPVQVQGFSLRFLDFVIPRGHAKGDARIGARLEANIDGMRTEITPFLAARHAPTRSDLLTQVPGLGASIRIDRISVEQRTVFAALLTAGGNEQSLVLRQGEKVPTGDYQLVFRDWSVPEPEAGHGGRFSVTIRLDVTHKGKSVAIRPVFSPGGASEPATVSEPAQVPGADAVVEISSVDIEHGAVGLTITPTVESVVLDVSTKPFISLLWIGSMIALAGGGIAMWRRTAELARAEEVEKQAAARPKRAKAATRA